MEQITLFGTMPDGTAIEQIRLSDREVCCEVLTYGGVLRSLTVPDREGKGTDVLLGFDRLEQYLENDKYMGALIGRYANRIGGGSFPLNGREYAIPKNDGGVNHLHGGNGFSTKVWRIAEVSEQAVTLLLTSPDGEEGYPGNLQIRATYTLSNGGLSIEYHGVSDRDTLCNLTSHAYFNLAGQGSGRIDGQQIQLFADAYTPTDARSIPTGEIAPVEGTPMDLRVLTPIGQHIEEAFPQLVMAGGYDHNWVLRGEGDAPRLAARAFSPQSGIGLEVLTTKPGIQFYSGNYLDGCPQGKGGAPYAKRWGFCLETQFFPDSPHQPDFPKAVLRAGETYRHKTIYRFSTDQTGFEK